MSLAHPSTESPIRPACFAKDSEECSSYTSKYTSIRRLQRTILAANAIHLRRRRGLPLRGGTAPPPSAPPPLPCSPPRTLLWKLAFVFWWGFGAGSLGFDFLGLGFGVWDLGFGVWGLWFEVWGLRFGVWGLKLGILGLGLWVG